MTIEHLEDYYEALTLLSEPAELSYPLLLAKLEAEGYNVTISGTAPGSHYYGEEPVQTKHGNGAITFSRKSRLIKECGIFLCKLLRPCPDQSGIEGTDKIATAFAVALNAASRLADSAEIPANGAPDLRYRTCLAAANELSTLAVMFGAKSTIGAMAVDTLLGLAEKNFNIVARDVSAGEDIFVIGYAYWRALADIVSGDTSAREAIWLNLGLRLEQTDTSADRMLAALRLPTADYVSQLFARTFAEMVLVAPADKMGRERHAAYQSIIAATGDVPASPIAFLDYPVRLTAEGMKIEEIKARVDSSGLILRRLAKRSGMFLRVGKMLTDRLVEVSGSPSLTTYGDYFLGNARELVMGFYHAPRRTLGPEPSP